MANLTSKAGVPAAQVFDAFDALAWQLGLTGPMPDTSDWRVRAYVAGCRAVAAEAGWTLAELSELRVDSFLPTV